MNLTASRRTAPIVAAIGLALAAVVLYQLNSEPVASSIGAVQLPQPQRQPDQQEQPSGLMPGVREPGDIFDPSKPLMVDTEASTTLRTAESKAEFNVALPAYLPGDLRGSAEYWYSETTGEVAVRYGDSLVIEYVPWVSITTPSEEYPRMAKEWQTGEATQLAGHAAWVIPAGSPNTTDPSVSEIYVAFNGVEVSLHGRIPFDELVKVASSLSTQEGS